MPNSHQNNNTNCSVRCDIKEEPLYYKDLVRSFNMQFVFVKGKGTADASFYCKTDAGES